MRAHSLPRRRHGQPEDCPAPLLTEKRLRPIMASPSRKKLPDWSHVKVSHCYFRKHITTLGDRFMR